MARPASRCPRGSRRCSPSARRTTRNSRRKRSEYDGGIFRLAAHLDRLEASARELAFESIPPRARIVAAIAATLAANGMRDGVHIRLTLTRGEKLTSGMSPRWNTAGRTLIVLAEWKPPVSGSGVSARGLRLITSSVRRNAPQCLSSRIHHANLLDNVLARLEAEAAGADCSTSRAAWPRPTP